MTTASHKLAANGLGQFFIHTYWYDGSVGEMGPFPTGEAACGAPSSPTTNWWSSRERHNACDKPPTLEVGFIDQFGLVLE